MKKIVDFIVNGGHVAAAIFSAFFFFCCILNGVYGYNVDLTSISMFYLVIVGKEGFQYHIDSKFNSKEGELNNKNK